MNVGGHIGLFECFVKSEATAGASALRVFTFEPAPDTFVELVSNITAQGLRGDHSAVKVHPIRAAVGAVCSEGASFTYYPNIPGNSTLHPDSKNGLASALKCSNSDEILRSQVRRKDTLLAAEVALHCKGVHTVCLARVRKQ